MHAQRRDRDLLVRRPHGISLRERDERSDRQHRGRARRDDRQARTLGVGRDRQERRAGEEAGGRHPDPRRRGAPREDHEQADAREAADDVPRVAIHRLLTRERVPDVQAQRHEPRGEHGEGDREEAEEAHLEARALVLEEEELLAARHDVELAPRRRGGDEQAETHGGVAREPASFGGARAEHHAGAEAEERGEQHEVREVAEDADLGRHVPHERELDEERRRAGERVGEAHAARVAEAGDTPSGWRCPPRGPRHTTPAWRTTHRAHCAFRRLAALFRRVLPRPPYRCSRPSPRASAPRGTASWA